VELLDAVVDWSRAVDDVASTEVGAIVGAHGEVW
jgi:hypothetical protein